MKLITLGIAFVAVGCAASPADQLFSQCTGTYGCTQNGGTGEGGYVMSRNGDACQVGDFLFAADGTVSTAPGVKPKSGTWSASAWSDNGGDFTFTAGEDSYSCDPETLVTCVRTFTATDTCVVTDLPPNTSCADNVVAYRCVSSSSFQFSAECTIYNDEEELAFSKTSCAQLGY